MSVSVSEASSRPDQWLVRTSTGKIQGPFSADKIRKMILSSELKLQDEVAQANFYWVQLSEYKEIESQLGVQVPVELDLNIESSITETDTDTLVPENMPDDGSSVMVRLVEPERVRNVLARPVAPKVQSNLEPQLEAQDRVKVLFLFLLLTILGAILLLLKTS